MCLCAEGTYIPNISHLKFKFMTFSVLRFCGVSSLKLSQFNFLHNKTAIWENVFRFTVQSHFCVYVGDGEEIWDSVVLSAGFI